MNALWPVGSRVVFVVSSQGRTGRTRHRACVRCVGLIGLMQCGPPEAWRNQMSLSGHTSHDLSNHDMNRDDSRRRPRLVTGDRQYSVG